MYRKNSSRGIRGGGGQWFAGTLILSALLASRPVAAESDPQFVRVLFERCNFCHKAVDGEDAYGPDLKGLFGRKAGSVKGFVYSDAMKESGLVWNERTLDAFLARPKAFMPGTSMEFGGVRHDEDRAGLVAYLKKHLKSK